MICGIKLHFSLFWSVLWGILFVQGPFIVWEGAPGVRTSSRGHHRHAFLFKNYIIICKQKRDTNSDIQTYTFKNMMKVKKKTAVKALIKKYIYTQQIYMNNV